MNLISVIIPVYNGQRFLSECITSVVNQDDLYFEVIIVDDGSTDKSILISEEFESKYNKIKVIKCKNSGVSIARNIGIANSSGDWIMFVDSDDMLLPGAIKEMRKHINENIDAIFANYVQNICKHNNTKYNSKVLDSKELMLLTCDRVKYLRELTLNIDIKPYTLTACWGKLFRKSVISKNNILFNALLKLSEDTIFNLEYLENVNKILLIDIPIYFYRENSLSVTKNFNESFLTNQINLIEFLTNKNFSDEKMRLSVDYYLIISMLQLNCLKPIKNKKLMNKKFIDLLKYCNIEGKCKSIRKGRLSDGKYQNIYYNIIIRLWKKSFFNTALLLGKIYSVLISIKHNLNTYK